MTSARARSLYAGRGRALCVAVVVAVSGVAVCAAIAAKPQEVRVSNLAGPQNEPAIAVDPRDDRILLAGSNSFAEGVTRVYSSTDGGASWEAGAAYPLPESRDESCAADPGVLIDETGRQYLSYIRATPCSSSVNSGGGREVSPRLFVSTRPGPDGTWAPPVQVAPLNGARADDKPAIALDSSPASRFRGRVYVGWTRIMRDTRFRILLSWSDDGGRSWSKPRRVSTQGREVTYTTIATAANGDLYIAWEDAENYQVRIARSIDGGASFQRERPAAAFSIVTIPSCGSGIPIPALRLQCAHANPILSVDRSRGPFRGRVYVTYAQTEFFGGQGVRMSIFSPSLRTLAGYPVTRLGVPVAEIKRGSRRDQFWAASTVDASTGALWVCFYDTLGDVNRKRAFFSCTASVDGGRTFAKPLRVASVPSDATDPDADPRGYGDYEGLVAANGVARPIWTDLRDSPTLSAEIYSASLSLAHLGLEPSG